MFKMTVRSAVWYWLIFEVVSAFPINTNGMSAENDRWIEYSSLLLSSALSACFILSIIGCLCCKGKFSFKELSSNVPSSVSSARRTRTSPTLSLCRNGGADAEFAIFPPPSSSLEDVVTFEPLPDVRILPSAGRTEQKRLVSYRVAGSSSGSSALDWFDNPHAYFPRKQLQYVRELGRGWFGPVVEGVGAGLDRGTHVPVVVKILRPDASPKEQMLFLQEAKPYRDLKHPNILQLLGRCLEADPLLLMLEHCSMGDLKSYLLRCAGNGEADSFMQRGEMFRFAYDVALGLKYMHDTNFIHTDLAARNCLVTSNLTVKVGDYGTGVETYRSDYYCVGEVALPIRWCAPESLHCTQTTIEPRELSRGANVWAFGVLLWELCTFGQLPYGELCDEEVIEKVLNATSEYRLMFQKSCHSSEFHNIVRQCWRADVEERPSLGTVLSKLDDLRRDGEFDARWNQLKPNQADSQGLCTHLSQSLQNVQGFPESLEKSQLQLHDLDCDTKENISFPSFHIGEESSVLLASPGMVELSNSLADDEELVSWWRRRIENEEISAKIREKSRSVQDLMVLTHIDYSDLVSDTESLGNCVTRGSNRNSLVLCSNSEGNLVDIGTDNSKIDAEFRQLLIDRRSSLRNDTGRELVLPQISVSPAQEGETIVEPPEIKIPVQRRPFSFVFQLTEDSCSPAEFSPHVQSFGADTSCSIISTSDSSSVTSTLENVVVTCFEPVSSPPWNGNADVQNSSAVTGIQSDITGAQSNMLEYEHFPDEIVANSVAGSSLEEKMNNSGVSSHPVTQYVIDASPTVQNGFSSGKTTPACICEEQVSGQVIQKVGVINLPTKQCVEISCDRVLAEGVSEPLLVSSVLRNGSSSSQFEVKHELLNSLLVPNSDCDTETKFQLAEELIMADIAHSEELSSQNFTSSNKNVHNLHNNSENVIVGPSDEHALDYYSSVTTTVDPVPFEEGTDDWAALVDSAERHCDLADIYLVSRQAPAMSMPKPVSPLSSPKWQDVEIEEERKEMPSEFYYTAREDTSEQHLQKHSTFSYDNPCLEEGDDFWKEQMSLLQQAAGKTLALFQEAVGEEDEAGGDNFWQVEPVNRNSQGISNGNVSPPTDGDTDGHAYCESEMEEENTDAASIYISYASLLPDLLSPIPEETDSCSSSAAQSPLLSKRLNQENERTEPVEDILEVDTVTNEARLLIAEELTSSHISDAHVPAATVPPDESPSEEVCYTPDWESDSSDHAEMHSAAVAPDASSADFSSDEEGSNSSTSTSGEFVWRPTVNYSDFPMEAIAEEDDCEEVKEHNSSSSESGEEEFVPAQWSHSAVPGRSAMRSPHASREPCKKNVSFKCQKHHRIYEYPREQQPAFPEPPVMPFYPSAPSSFLRQQVVDYAQFTDWELGAEEDAVDSAEDDDPSDSDFKYAVAGSNSVVTDKQPKPTYDFYSITAEDTYFIHGMDADEDEFFVSSSARPFEFSPNVFSGSEFFPGSSEGCDEESGQLVNEELLDSDYWGTGTLATQSIGELRHTKDQLKLELPMPYSCTMQTHSRHGGDETGSGEALFLDQDEADSGVGTAGSVDSCEKEWSETGDET